MPAARYLSLYRIVTSDIAQVARDVEARAPAETTSPVLDPVRTYGYTYRAIGPRLDGDALRRQRGHR